MRTKLNSSNPVKVGVIGCGRIAQQRHLPILRRLDNVQIVAVADTDPKKLSFAADRYGVDRRYEDYRALIDDPSIDAVAVCTPPAEHFIQANAVLASSRHLFLETPTALSAGDCDSLIEMATKSTAIATVASNLRYHPFVERARKCIQDGLLGPVQAISATFTTPSRGYRSDKLPEWRNPEILDGGVLSEGALHHFDVWRTLTASDFTEISVQCCSIGGPVSLSATMGSSIVVGAVFSEYAGDNNEIRVMGRDGTLTLSFYRYNGFDYCPAPAAHGSLKQHLRFIAESITALPRGLRASRQGGDFGRSFELQWQAFIHSVRHGDTPRVSLTDGRAALQTVLAAVESMATQRPVRLSR